MVGIAFCPHPPAVAGDDAPYNTQANPGTFELLAGMQTLENTKQTIGVMGIETYAIIPHEINDLPGFLSRVQSGIRWGTDQLSYLDDRLLALSGKLERIGEQVQVDLAQHQRISLDPGQVRDVDFHLALVQCRAQLFQHLLDNRSG